MPLIDLLAGARVYDLGQPYFTGMPHYPTHPPFLYSLIKKHGEFLHGECSSAADALAMGAHTGTHIDALNHFSCGGKVFGGIEVEDKQSYGGGVEPHSIDTVAPIVRRGVLLDVARHLGVESLEAEVEITVEILEQCSRGLEIRPGDVVLLRTGWGQFFEDAPRFIRRGEGPGPTIDGAKWLSSRGVFAVGADTVAFEKTPSTMPVHVHLLVEKGIHIIEILFLEDLSRDGVREFGFVAAPMKIRGGTGGPVRPIALVGD